MKHPATSPTATITATFANSIDVACPGHKSMLSPIHATSSNSPGQLTITRPHGSFNKMLASTLSKVG